MLSLKMGAHYKREVIRQCLLLMLVGVLREDDAEVDKNSRLCFRYSALLSLLRH